MKILDLQKSKSWEYNPQKEWTLQAFNQIICALVSRTVECAIKDPKERYNVQVNMNQKKWLKSGIWWETAFCNH